MMMGGETEVVQRLDPIFAALAPGMGDIPPTAGRDQIDETAEQGYLHAAQTAPATSSRWSTTESNVASWRYTLKVSLFSVKLTSASKQTSQSTPKLRHCADPKQYERDMSLQDKAEVWPRSSVIASWLLDLTAAASFGTRIFRGSPAVFSRFLRAW
jgi:6-phosphogluconate dehydrogenase